MARRGASFGFGFGFSPGRGKRASSGGDVVPTITTASTADVEENAALAISLTSDQSVTWSITGGADSAQFEINGTTLRWASNGTKDFDDPDDVGADNAYVVQVRATNGTSGLFATKTITVTVTDLTEIGAPALTLTDDEVNPPLYDVDFAGTGTEAGDTLRIEWAYASDFTGSTTEDEVLDTELLTGNLEGAFPLWDAGLTEGETVYWRIKVLRNPGEVDEIDSGWSNTLSAEVLDDTAPTITSSSSGSIAENATLSHALTADEAVTWAIRTSAENAASVDYDKFELSGSTLRWLSNGTKDFEAPDDTGTNNTYVVVVRATDGASNTADQTITITVTDVAEGAPFDPTAVFSHWWDASDEGTITGSPGATALADQVDTWHLTSDAGNAPTTGDATKDLNGLNVLSFDGTEKLWHPAASGRAISDSFDIFVLMYVDSISTTFELGDYNDADPRVAIRPTAGPDYRLNISGVGATSVNAGGPPSTGAWHLFRIQGIDNTSLKWWIDGSAKPDAGGTYTGFGGVNVSLVIAAGLGGGSEITTRFVCAGLIDGGAISGGDLTAFHAYLNTKFGLSL